MVETYDRLLDFDEWAMHGILDECSELTDEQLDRQFDIGHKSVRETVIHLVWNLGFWRSLMSGGGVLPEPEWTGVAIAELTAWYDQSFAAFSSLTRTLRDENRLDEVFADHWNVRKSMGGTILTVLFHASEHRMEITHMLIRLDAPRVGEWDLGARDYELLNC